MYSQNNEESIIRYHFRNRIGRFLDIGANDGKTFSNSLWCAENDWSGVCVEPSKKAFQQLTELHKDRKSIQCINVAVGTEDGEVEFYESGEHIGKGDHSLLSTINANELKRWKGKSVEFTKTNTRVVSWKSLQKMIDGSKEFDLITIDAEGMDLDIVRQMDFNLTKTKMLIVEYNRQLEWRYRHLCATFGLKFTMRNNENLVFTK